MNVIGDVTGKDTIIIDDIVDTAGTLTQSAAAMKSKGARPAFSPTSCIPCCLGLRSPG